MPMPRPVPLPRALPVKSIKIDTKISAQVATTHVEQIFRNDTDATLEGTYFFPIPETASITEFAIWEGDQRLVGEVRSREEARRIYDQIVRSQRDPGLLEYAGKDLFEASIFPILPHSDKKLELTYSQVLRAETATVSYRYPLGTGRNMATIGTVAGSIEIQGRDPVRNIYSPSHEVDVKRSDGERRARVSFESRGGSEPQDFQLFYTLSKEDFGLTLLTHREPGKDGYFLLMISPKEEMAEEEYAGKDIVFVLDTSGSMAEAGKMEKARAALRYGVQTLRATDRFNVISFAGEEHLMSSGLIAADDEGRARGVAFVERLRPVGGTNINDALLASLKQFESNERPRMLVFMTDGLPTLGEKNIQRIIENARQARTPGTRLFTFGVGYDVNTTLLDKLAAENGGVADYVEPKEDIELKVSSFFSKVNYPVLTDLALHMGGIETDLIYPRTMPDLFRGTQITLIGRYRNANDMSNVLVRLNGKTGQRVRNFAYNNLRFPFTSNENDFLPRLWATRRVGWLMEQIRSNGEQQELRDEIVDLGTRYGIVTPYTSYLALEPGASTAFATDQTMRADGSRPLPSVIRPELRGSVRAKTEPMKRRPANTASGNVRSGEGGGVDAPPPAPVTATTGAAAVRQSREARRQQDAMRADDAEQEQSRSSTMRRVGGKTFYLNEGVWTDAEFDADGRMPETTLVFGSDEYFQLLKREPKLAEFFALGERVVVVFKNRVYRVSATK
jgi:Ca-activated chloride channel family protein